MKTIAFEDILGEKAMTELTDSQVDELLEEFLKMAEEDPKLKVIRINKDK